MKENPHTSLTATSKTDFNSVYNQPDPRAYFAALQPFSYQTRPPIGIPKGRPRNSGPFGNERAIPEQQLAPEGSTRSGVQSSARRNYSQFELGSTIDEQDGADSLNQRRRKRGKTAVSATARVAHQQSRTRKDGNRPIKQYNTLEVDDDPEAAALLEVGMGRMATGKVGDSITVALD